MDFCSIGRTYPFIPNANVVCVAKPALRSFLKSNQSYSLKGCDCAIIKAFFKLARKDTKQTDLMDFKGYFLDM